MLQLALSCGFLFGEHRASFGQSPSPTLRLVAHQTSEIDRIVNQNIDRGNMSGCVVAIGDQNGMAFCRSYGHLQVLPSTQDMTNETVFDLASLTKPIATASAIMKLVEQGKIEVDAPACRYWPEFGDNGKNTITIRHLLLHQSGLVPDNPLRDYENGAADNLKCISNLGVTFPPGKGFAYSDVGFIVLAEIVNRVSEMDIADYALTHFYQPLAMHETMFRPGIELQRRAAATEKITGQWRKGTVHDPRAALMGGVAGHAGLFSTAHDLSRFARMLLGKGMLDGVKVLNPETVDLMAQRQDVGNGFRTLGWDSLSGYSSNRGDLYSASAYGHGGFTGTSFWVDPKLDLFVIFLSNRLHPDGKGSVNSVAGRIGTIAAASRLRDDQQPEESKQPVSTGVDILERENFKRLRDKRVGLITNQTGISLDGRRTSVIFHESPNVNLVAIFSPEHGIDGMLDEPEIGNSQYGKTGVNVFSLYGESRAPSAEQLAALDVVVFDIQDIGTRFYTYISTMGLAMEACAKSGVEFVVLDRPNPINGIDVQGPGIDASKTDQFVSFHNLPVRHGMTVGELAGLFVAERGLREMSLDVVELEGWDRGDFFDQTGLRWVNPSPNIRNLTQALIYPGIGLLEMTNISVGRGTDSPFEVIGAPWIDEIQLARGLNDMKMPGVSFVPVQFTPATSKFKNETCHGVNLVVTNRKLFHPLRTGFQIANYLAKKYGATWDQREYNRLLKNQSAADQITSPLTTPKTILELAKPNSFYLRRKQYLLYE